ncbi:LuxR C-terminal-related transcriptional regulator [Synechococcus sp. A10-1-5-9]|uniref:response regulator transcription factor n=1 Tax=Synechococcus sp. A10-1-5-9 TaxID=3392295 RepID=UPI0039E81103
MQFDPKSEQLQAVTQKSKSLWDGTTAVVAMGDLLTLAAFSLFPPITNTLVGSFSTEREALAACKDKQPDLLYVTECLEQGYGIPLAVKVKAVSPNTRVLLLLHRENQEVVRDALDAHIDGIAFVSSIGQGFDGDFFKSLEAMADGNTYYPKKVRETAGFKKGLILNELSSRETEVLEALCQGMSNKEIAEVMVVSTETIKSHVSTIISKLGVKDRTQAVIACIRAGI